MRTKPHLDGFWKVYWTGILGPSYSSSTSPNFMILGNSPDFFVIHFLKCNVVRLDYMDSKIFFSF